MSWDDEDDDKPVSVLEDEDEKEHKGAQAQPPARIGSITQDAEEIPASIIGAHPSAMPKQQPSIAQQQTQSITGPAPAQTPPAGSITAGPLDHPGPAAQREQDLLGNKPEYHGWKKALDVLGRVTGLGRNIEEGTGLGTLGYEQRLAQAHRDAQREQALTMAPLQASYEQSRAGEENAKAEQERARAEALTHPPVKPVKPEPLYDKAGNLIGFQVGDELIGPNSQKLTPDMKDMLQAAKPKPDKPDTETEEAQRYEKIRSAQSLKQQVTPEDQAWAQAYKERKTLGPAASVALNAPKVRDERADKSFQYNNTALDKVATPIDQINQRMGRLNDTLAQNTPQADALVAPELLSVMSGGQGSGLRMNEAEISRIVGGRSNWESLKAAVNKWSLDPKEALSITPEQRQEIRALAKTVQDKLVAKEKIIDDARNQLIDADDPKEHRRIVADTKKKLDEIDSGNQPAAEGGGAGGGHNFTYNGNRYENVPDELYKKYKGKPGFQE